MKKSDPKIILNLRLEDPELEKRIQIAMDKYVESVINKHLDSIIQNAIDKRIEKMLNAPSYSNEGRIGGLPLYEYVKRKTTPKIENYVSQNIHDILTKKLSSLI